MSARTIGFAYRRALAFAALHVSTTAQARAFAESFVGSIVRLADPRDWPEMGAAFYAWTRDAAIAEIAAQP